MEIKLLKLLLFKMTILDFEDFMIKCNLKSATMYESELQRIYTYPIHPRDSKVHSDKGFVDKDNGSQGGTHWCWLILRDNKSYYYDSFGGTPDKVLLKQLPKPMKYHNYKIQVINSNLCGSFCLNFMYLIERME